MDSQLRTELAEFGIMRQKALDGTKASASAHFGISADHKQMAFGTSMADTPSGMDTAIIVQGTLGETNIIQPQTVADLKKKSKVTIQKYLRKLLESV